MAEEQTNTQEKKEISAHFNTPDVWTMEHYARFVEAKERSGYDGNIGSYYGAVALIKAGFVKVECSDADVKAKIMRWLDANEAEQKTIPVPFIGFVIREIAAPLNASLLTDPNW